MTKSLDSQDITADEVVGVISALIRSEHRHAAFVASTLDLPLADTLALYHLANEPLSAKALGEHLNLTSGSVTALIDRLVDRKIARRLRHPTDRRVVLVELTKTGHAQSWKVMQFFIGGVVALANELSPAERIAVNRFLRQLVEAIDTDTHRLKDESQADF
jgi:DNA-binding MarR family transcriptional regulator